MPGLFHAPSFERQDSKTGCSIPAHLEGSPYLSHRLFVPFAPFVVWLFDCSIQSGVALRFPPHSITDPPPNPCNPLNL